MPLKSKYKLQLSLIHDFDVHLILNQRESTVSSSKHLPSFLVSKLLLVLFTALRQTI